MCFRMVMSMALILTLLVTSNAFRRRHNKNQPDDEMNESYDELDLTSDKPKLAFINHYLTVSLKLANEPKPSGSAAQRGSKATKSEDGRPCRFNISVWDKDIQIRYDRDQRDDIFLPDAEIRLIRDGDGINSDEFQERIELETISRDFVRGQVEGDPASFVIGYEMTPSGTVRHGHGNRGSTFVGLIATDGESYHLESASNFFSDSLPYDAVVYRDSDVSAGPDDDSSTAVMCLALERHGDSADEDRLRHEKAKGSGLSAGVDRLLSNIVATSHSDRGALGGEARSFRIEGNLPDDPLKLVKKEYVRRVLQGKDCHLRLILDRSFFLDFAGGDAKRAVREVGQRVREVDHLFRSADFNGDGKPDGIGFRIKAIDILDREDEAHDQLADDTINSNDEPLAFLTRLIQHDFSDACLGFVFTSRPFYGATVEGSRRGSILGAAFTGSLTLPTGACSPQVRISGNDHRMASLNSGFVTMRFDESARVVPRARNVLTIAHEFGHAFGASHDDEPHEIGETNEISDGTRHRHHRGRGVAKRHSCNPDGWRDKFLMTSFSPLGSSISDSNRKFSVCSRSAIKNYVNAKGFCLVSEHDS